MAASVKTFINNSPPSVEDDDLNGLIQENNRLITGAGLVLDDTDHDQTHQAIAIYSSGGDFYTDSGSANAVVLSTVGLKISPPAYFEGMRISFDPATINTGPATVNVSSLGVASLTLDGISAMYPGSLSPGKVMDFFYNGTAFQLVDPLSVLRGATINRSSDSALTSAPFDVIYNTVLFDSDGAADIGGANPERITIPAWVRFAKFYFGTVLTGSAISRVSLSINSSGFFIGSSFSGDVGILTFEGNGSAWIPVLPGDFYTVNVGAGNGISVLENSWFSAEFR